MERTKLVSKTDIQDYVLPHITDLETKPIYPIFAN